jgi:hypothetical protein
LHALVFTNCVEYGEAETCFGQHWRRGSSLAHLNLGYNIIAAEGAGQLAAVLGQCPSLAHLNLRVNVNCIRDEGAGQLAAVLGQYRSLTHLDLRYHTQQHRS